MVLEIYYLDYQTAINYSEELIYNNTNPYDPAKARTTMNNGLLYNTDGTVGGSVEVINFIREDPNSAFVTSMFSISTNNGLLCFNVVRKYDSSYNPVNDVIVSQSCYSSGSYLSNSNVTMIIETVGDFPNLVFKISLVYGL